MLPYFGLLPTHLEITKNQRRSTWQRWQRAGPSNQHHAPIRLGIASTASLTQHVIIYHHLTEEWSPVLCNVAKTTKPILNAFTTWKLWVFLQLNSFNSKEQNIIITCYQNHHRHSCGCLGSFRHSFLSLIFHCQCKLTQTFFLLGSQLSGMVHICWQSAKRPLDCCLPSQMYALFCHSWAFTSWGTISPLAPPPQATYTEKCHPDVQ